MSEKEHILTDEEREFLSSFSYCGSDQVTLDDWVKSFGGDYASPYSGLYYLLKVAMANRQRENIDDNPTSIDFTDEEVQVLHNVGKWDLETLVSTGTLRQAAKLGGGNANNVIKRLAELLVESDRREKSDAALVAFKSRVRDKAKEVAREMDWCLEGVNRVLRSLDIEEWDTLVEMVEAPIVIETKQIIHTVFVVPEDETTLHTEVKAYLRNATIPFDDFEWKYET